MAPPLIGIVYRLGKHMQSNRNRPAAVGGLVPALRLVGTGYSTVIVITSETIGVA